MSSFDLDSHPSRQWTLSRINRLPIALMVVLIIVFAGVVFWGLSGRGIGSSDENTIIAPGHPASDLAEALTEGVRPGIVQAPSQDVPDLVPLGLPDRPPPATANPFQPQPDVPRSPGIAQIELAQTPPSAQGWRERLERELAEAQLREAHRQRLAATQARHTAASSPLLVDLSRIDQWQDRSRDDAQAGRPWVETGSPAGQGINGLSQSAADGSQITGAALGGGERFDPFVLAQVSPFELKRGSVIPATLISAINSDLPGHVSAQVSQNVYDSATGHHLLIPQGAKLVGRYQSGAEYGQKRVFVTWSDLVFPDGATLSLGQWSGIDVAGYGGFSDRVDNRYFEMFGAAALVALIGTGIDLASPRPDPRAPTDPWQAGRSNIAQSLGTVAEQTITRTLDVSPTLEIRSGYRFNVFVERDLLFPGPYQSTS